MSGSKQGATNGERATDSEIADTLASDQLQPQQIQPQQIQPQKIPLGETAPDRHAEDRHSEVGEFIRLQRERANLSLRRLADRAGISNPYLSQIERGVRKPSAEILKRISRALSISAETLYTRAGLIEAGTNALPVIDAIEADPGLSPRHKQVLLDVYRTLVVSGSASDTDPGK